MEQHDFYVRKQQNDCTFYLLCIPKTSERSCKNWKACHLHETGVDCYYIHNQNKEQRPSWVSMEEKPEAKARSVQKHTQIFKYPLNNMISLCDSVPPKYRHTNWDTVFSVRTTFSEKTQRNHPIPHHRKENLQISQIPVYFHMDHVQLQHLNMVQAKVNQHKTLATFKVNLTCMC